MKEWLSGIIGESAANIVGFVVVFALILAAIFAVLAVLRRFGGGGSAVSGARSRQPRLSVMDAAAVDGRRKLVLIRRDDVEHLLLIGGPTDVVVEQNIVMESRAGARVASRIEPEHIERFRQHEAELAAPSLAIAPKEEAIQLNSPIEAPAYRRPQAEPQPEPMPEPRPEPRVEHRPEPMAAPWVEPTHEPAPRPAPAEAAAPRPRPVEPPAPAVPVPPRVEPARAPRPAAAVNPQPRPAAPRPTPQSDVPRAHPAYPLSQVSQGVLSSTSGLSGGLSGATVAASAASLGGVTPQRETPAPKAPEPAPQPEPVAAKPADPEPDFSLDSLDEGLGGALHDAIMADLETDDGALDIPAAGRKQPAEDDIEDEMEKLLGALGGVTRKG